MKKMTIILGEDFVLSFNSNPTTGFSWEPKFDENYLKLKNKTFEPSTSAMGSGGREEFTFTSLKCGEVVLILHYKRPWEKIIAEKSEILIKIQK